jgi:hypothetical protein
MCKKDRKVIIDLKTKFADPNYDDGLYRTFQMPFHTVLQHPVRGSNLWNVRVSYFGMYIAQGLDACKNIDIVCDAFSSNYTLTNDSRGHIIGTSNADLLDQDVTLTDAVPDVTRAVGFYIGAEECPWTTININNLHKWAVSLYDSNSLDRIVSTPVSGGASSEDNVQDWYLRLEFMPVVDHE